MNSWKLILIAATILSASFAYIAWFKYQRYVDFEVRINKANPFVRDLEQRYQAPLVKLVIRLVTTLLLIGLLGTSLAVLAK